MESVAWQSGYIAQKRVVLFKVQNIAVRSKNSINTNDTKRKEYKNKTIGEKCKNRLQRDRVKRPLSSVNHKKE